MEKKKYVTPHVGVYVIDSEELLQKFGGTGSTDPTVQTPDGDYELGEDETGDIEIY